MKSLVERYLNMLEKLDQSEIGHGYSLLTDSLCQTIAAIEERIEPLLNDWFTSPQRVIWPLKIFPTALQFLCCTIPTQIS